MDAMPAWDIMRGSRRAVQGRRETIQRDVQLFRIVGGVIKVERGQ